METRHTQKRLNFYCQIIIVLLGLITLRLWTTPVDLLPTAQAQFGDSGAQRIELIQAAKKTNALLSAIDKTLKGTLAVRIEEGKSNAKAKNSKRPAGH